MVRRTGSPREKDEGTELYHCRLNIGRNCLLSTPWSRLPRAMSSSAGSNEIIGWASEDLRSLQPHPPHTQTTCYHSIANTLRTPSNLYSYLILFSSLSASRTSLHDMSHSPQATIRALFLFSAALAGASHDAHHIKRFAQPLDLERRQNTNTPLIISNQCGETIYPGILTQGGTGPGTGGFQLTAGSNKTLSVSENWQGRVWGRTNCTFNGGSSGSCSTGDCGGVVSCIGTVCLRTICLDRVILKMRRVKSQPHLQSSHSMLVMGIVIMTCLSLTATTYLWQ